LSSTTERRAQRGQILILFAGGLAAIMIVAALAFDVGMMLVERRAQQNTADAAALHAARYVLIGGNAPGVLCPGPTEPASANPAVRAACALAYANEYGNEAAETVRVHIPPVHGTYAGLPGFVEVEIDAARPSIFGGILGRALWDVGVYSVAGNQEGVTFSFGMLALNRTECKALQVSGSGVVLSNANIHSNSTGADCDGSPIGFSRTGGGTLIVDAKDAVCRSASLIQDQGSGEMKCSQSPNTFGLPDPLLALQAPIKPPAVVPPPNEDQGTPALIPVGHSDVPPKNCPGTNDTVKPASPFTETQTSGCEVDKAWIFGPGLYPAGISVKGPNAVAYLLPGIYWIGGGGFSTSNGGSVISVESASNLTGATCDSKQVCTGGGGVLIYNSKLPTKAAGPVTLGGGGATLRLMPYEIPFKDTTIDLVLFQDREVCLTVKLNGSSANASFVRGIVYVPCGEVQVNGSTSEFTVDQVISDTFKINGSGGTINVLRNDGVDAEISGIGLVE
jgi:hypothetical protein